MGDPEFKLRDLIKRENIRVFSSNYALYGDVSRRVSDTLGSMVPTIENYSIDESFLNLGEFAEREVEPLARARSSLGRHPYVCWNCPHKDTREGRQLQCEKASAVSRCLRYAFQPGAG